MANLPNITETIIATGYNCHVRVGESVTNVEYLGMVTSFQANEDFQVQEATCIGNLGPISIDPQGYTCSITIDGFLPAKKKMNGEQLYAGDSKTAIMDYVPDRAKFMVEDGDMPKIEYMDFYNKQSGEILCSFSGVLITNNGVSADGNTYVKNNVQMRALSWNKD